jgi:hypothetical protein
MDALTLEKYKTMEISKIVAQFNQSMLSLNNDLKNQINKINYLRINIQVKRAYINNLMNAYNSIVNNLNKTKNDKIIAIQNLRPTNRLPEKTALLIGINYKNTSSELSGCINDTNNIKNLLTTNYGYKNINILTDDTPIKPTKANIIKELTTILTNSINGDNIFILYSGHGTQTTDISKDESDGLDECIVPLNATSINDCIIDDELNNIFKTNLKDNVKVFCLFDSCFSGTILDLKYNYTNNNELIVNSEPDLNKKIIVISGCSDTQTSSDAYINGVYTGAMVYSFLNSIKSDMMLSDLTTNMRELLKENNYTQVPQLSLGYNGDIKTLNISKFIDVLE